MKSNKKTFFWNNVVRKKQLVGLLYWTFRNFGIARAGYLADSLKILGFNYATKSGISIGIEDLKTPPYRTVGIESSIHHTNHVHFGYLAGNYTEREKYQEILQQWANTSINMKMDAVTFFKNTDPLNSIYVMAFSGARGNLAQVRQLVGMRGLMVGPTGAIINIPIQNNFRKGLEITDYMISSYGARKGLVDTSLKTAESGYLTRRLVDVGQALIIREIDCNTRQGISIFGGKERSRLSLSLKERLEGRFLAEDMINLKGIAFPRNTLITPLLAQNIEKLGAYRVLVRSPLTCELSRSICQKCYGWNVSHSKIVSLGYAVGVLSAQSIGEPGTQLTMRTFHTGGIFDGGSGSQLVAKESAHVTYDLGNVKKIRRKTCNTFEDYSIVSSKYTPINFMNFKGKKITVILRNKSLVYVKSGQCVSLGQLLAENFTLEENGMSKNSPIRSVIKGEVTVSRKPKLLPIERERENPDSVSLAKKNYFIWVSYGTLLALPHNAIITKKNFSHFGVTKSFSKNKIVCWKSGIISPKPNNLFPGTQINVLTEKILLYSLKVFQVKIKNHNRKKNTEKNFKIIIFEHENKYYILKNFREFAFYQDSVIAESIEQRYKIKTGGMFYCLKNSLSIRNKLLRNCSLSADSSLFYIPEETYFIKKRKESLTKKKKKKNTIIEDGQNLLQDGNFLEKSTKISDGVLTKTAGLIKITNFNTWIKQIVIKSGSLFSIKNIEFCKKFDKQIFFRGERLPGKKSSLEKMVFVEITKNTSSIELLSRPIYLYNFPINNTFVRKEFGLKTPGLKKVIFSNLKKKLKIISSREFNLIKIKLKLIKKINSPKPKRSKSFVQTIFVKRKHKTVEFAYAFFESFGVSKIDKLFDPICDDSYIYRNSHLFHNYQYLEPYTVLAHFESLPKENLYLYGLKERKDIEKRELLILSDQEYLSFFHEKTSKVAKKYDFFCTRFSISDNYAILAEGKVTEEPVFKTRVRPGHPLRITSCSLPHKKSGDFVLKEEFVATLSLTQAQSGDIISGLPEVEQILEARRSNIKISGFNRPSFKIETYSGHLLILDRLGLFMYYGKRFQYDEIDYFTIGYPNRIEIGPHTIVYYSCEHYKNFLSLFDATYRSFRKVQVFLVNIVQSIYCAQGVIISEKHLEVVVKQMTSKVRIKDRGDSGILPGEIMNLQQVFLINQILQRNRLKTMYYTPILLGITKSALVNDSFISAASFQETVRILTQAAIEGKADWLVSLKENVIIGRLVPVGTGFNFYEHISYLDFKLPVR